MDFSSRVCETGWSQISGLGRYRFRSDKYRKILISHFIVSLIPHSYLSRYPRKTKSFHSSFHFAFYSHSSDGSFMVYGSMYVCMYFVYTMHSFPSFIRLSDINFPKTQPNQKQPSIQTLPKPRSQILNSSSKAPSPQKSFQTPREQKIVHAQLFSSFRTAKHQVSNVMLLKFRFARNHACMIYGVGQSSGKVFPPDGRLESDE